VVERKTLLSFGAQGEIHKAYYIVETFV